MASSGPTGARCLPGRAGPDQPGSALLPGRHALAGADRGAASCRVGSRLRERGRSRRTARRLPARPCAARSSTWSSAACWSASAGSAPRSCTPRCAGRSSCPACTTTWSTAGQRAAHRGPRPRVRTAPDHVAEALGVPEGTEVTWFERLRYAGGEPLAMMHNALPVDLLRADRGRPGAPRPLRAAARRRARPADGHPGDRRALGDRRRGPDARRARGAPLLTMTRTAWDASGRAVEYGSHLYRASRYSFEISLTS